MSSGPEPGRVVDRFVAAFAEVAAQDLARLGDEQLIEQVRVQEQVRRQMVAHDHGLIAEVSQRIAAGRIGARDARSFLVDCLRITPGEAGGRVRAARDLGPRRTLTGQPVAPTFAVIAAAQTSGALSADHARAIITVIDALPPQQQAEHGEQVEAVLVRESLTFHPTIVAGLGARIQDQLNPDGVQPGEEEHHRRRGGSFRRHRDRSGQLTARLSPIVATKWQSVLDSLTQPQSSDQQPDLRSHAQRVHDALDIIATRMLASAGLPAVGGMPATVLITMSLDQLETRLGLASTSHGGHLTITEALSLAGDGQILPVVIDDTGVLAYGRSRRTATLGQRYCLSARDRGCSFPGCDYPPEYCEVHHVAEWARDHGPTDINNLTLLCTFHHHNFTRLGWQVHMTNGYPWWQPPPWKDPTQHPIQNTTHHPPLIFTNPGDPGDPGDQEMGPPKQAAPSDKPAPPEKPPPREHPGPPEEFALPEEPALPEDSVLPEELATPEESVLTAESVLGEDSVLPEEPALPEQLAQLPALDWPEEPALPEESARPAAPGWTEESAVPQQSERPDQIGRLSEQARAPEQAQWADSTSLPKSRAPDR